MLVEFFFAFFKEVCSAFSLDRLPWAVSYPFWRHIPELSGSTQCVEQSKTSPVPNRRFEIKKAADIFDLFTKHFQILVSIVWIFISGVRN